MSTKDANTNAANADLAGTGESVRIDIFSDIACPWCYLGEARLNVALAETGVEAKVYWQPFQLQPDLPPRGISWRHFAERKFGSWERALAAFADLKRLGEADALNFNFENIAKANNTADAHRLVLYAEAQGLGREAAHDLYRAYFERGQDLNDLAVLADVATGLGLDAGMLTIYLQSDANCVRVSASQTEASRLGVSGVPFYIFNRQVGLSGAQPVEIFGRALIYASTI